MTSERIRSAGTKVMRALSRIDDKRPDELRSLSLSQLQCLFYVAAHAPDVKLSSIYRDLGLSGGTAQRSISLLGPRNTRNAKAPSLGLVVITMDNIDQRERVVNLTVKGKRLMEDIANEILGKL